MTIVDKFRVAKLIASVVEKVANWLRVALVIASVRLVLGKQEEIGSTMPRD